MEDRTLYKIASDIFQKLQFYFVTLSFTVLTFALKTWKSSSYFIANIPEWISWICLLVSGLMGLHVLELMYKRYREMDRILQIEDLKEQAKAEKNKRTQDRVEENLISMYNKRDELVNKEVPRIKWQKRLLFSGILILFFLRLVLQMSTVLE